jgi:hypothetical protein
MTANAWVMASAVLISIVASAHSTDAQVVQAAEAREAATVNAPVRICAVYISQVGAPTLDVRTMEREVNQIWAPYGVTLEGLVEPCKTPGEGPTLKVRVRKMENVRPVGIPRGTLGNIYFVAGKPTPLIDLWADEAIRVMGGNHVTFNQGVADPRTRIEMGRLLGRSLAHELGHYLLASRVHTEAGLMRRVYDQQDGKSKTRGCFSLDEGQVAALARTVSGWRVANANAEGQPAGTPADMTARKVTLDPSGM